MITLNIRHIRQVHQLNLKIMNSQTSQTIVQNFVVWHYKKFTFPVAYHLTNSLDSEHSALLVKEIITELTKQGMKICNLTFDGAKENLAMCSLLGANLDALSAKNLFKIGIFCTKLYSALLC